MSSFISGGLILNGSAASEIMLTHAEFAPWKRIIIEHDDMPGAYRKMLIVVELFFTLVMLEMLLPRE